MEQRSNQSVQKFYHVLTSTIQQCNVLATTENDKISERDQLNIFLDGLLPHVQQLATIQHHETLAEAFNATQQAESALKLTKTIFTPQILITLIKGNKEVIERINSNTKLVKKKSMSHMSYG